MIRIWRRRSYRRQDCSLKTMLLRRLTTLLMSFKVKIFWSKAQNKGSRLVLFILGEKTVREMIKSREVTSVRLNPVKSLESESRRSFVQRSFSQMGSGSLRGSVFALTASAIGSGMNRCWGNLLGVLTLPNVFMNNGWLLGMLLIIFGGLGCCWSLYMLVQRARHHNLYSYNEIAEKAGGPLLLRYL